jgi:periplasmic divalent cation tolerance protein
MADGALVVFCTFPNAETAREIVKEMVQLRLAACGNILPKVRSIYRWQGRVESADEALAIFKLPANRYAEFETTLRALHPYEVPEIIAFSIERGVPDYLQWIADSCGDGT